MFFVHSPPVVLCNMLAEPYQLLPVAVPSVLFSNCKVAHVGLPFLWWFLQYGCSEARGCKIRARRCWSHTNLHLVAIIRSLGAAEAPLCVLAAHMRAAANGRLFLCISYATPHSSTPGPHFKKKACFFSLLTLGKIRCFVAQMWVSSKFQAFQAHIQCHPLREVSHVHNHWSAGALHVIRYGHAKRVGSNSRQTFVGMQPVKEKENDLMRSHKRETMSSGLSCTRKYSPGVRRCPKVHLPQAC